MQIEGNHLVGTTIKDGIRLRVISIVVGITIS